ncbi:MAG: potassium-transporting ATPase subunit F [Burkholderiales bacterium]|nr:potassium-transporting ATPase subunit F [Burkholderiales bacterium]
MSGLLAGAGVVVALLLVYLVAVLFAPEKFS